MTDRLDYAGKYLRDSEAMRYTFWQRQLWLDKFIVVPSEAEEFSDISFYQAGMDWDKYAQHARAVILRIGQNIWPDTEFEYNYNEAKRKGIAVGGYFFFDGRATPQQQANVIITAMQGKSFELELFIDWERSYGGASEGLPKVVQLMQLVEAANVHCKAVGLYTGFYFFSEHSNASANAAQYTYLKTRPLWIAWYAAASLVRIPLPWTEWTNWQYGTPAIDWGQMTAEIDMNKSIYTRAEFAARYLGGITPPDTGGTMHYGRVKTFTNIRNSPPGGTYQDIGDLSVGDEVTADEIRLVSTVPWWHVKSVSRNGQPLDLPGAECWAYGVNIEEHPAPVVTIESVNIQLAPGSTVTTKKSDGTEETVTA